MIGTSTFPCLWWVSAARITLERKSSLGNGLLPIPWCSEVKHLCKLHECLLIFNLISRTLRRSDFYLLFFFLLALGTEIIASSKKESLQWTFQGDFGKGHNAFERKMDVWFG